MSWAGLFSTSKFPLHVYGDLDSSYTRFLELTRVHIPNSISIGYLRFSRSWPTYRPTDQATPSVAIGRSAAMRPNKELSYF